MKIFIIIISIIILLLVIYMLFQNNQSKAQGVDENSLFACHWKPNCISSRDKNDDLHYYPAIKINQSKFEKLLNILKTTDNIKIIKHDNYYIHAVASTKIGFKDDIEFYFEDKKNICHLRSVSRVGIRDFAVNKKRMDKILKRLNE